MPTRVLCFSHELEAETFRFPKPPDNSSELEKS